MNRKITNYKLQTCINSFYDFILNKTIHFDCIGKDAVTQENLLSLTIRR